MLKGLEPLEEIAMVMKEVRSWLDFWKNFFCPCWTAWRSELFGNLRGMVPRSKGVLKVKALEVLLAPIRVFYHVVDVVDAAPRSLLWDLNFQHVGARDNGYLKDKEVGILLTWWIHLAWIVAVIILEYLQIQWFMVLLLCLSNRVVSILIQDQIQLRILHLGHLCQALEWILVNWKKDLEKPSTRNLKVWLKLYGPLCLPAWEYFYHGNWCFSKSSWLSDSPWPRTSCAQWPGWYYYEVANSSFSSSFSFSWCRTFWQTFYVDQQSKTSCSTWWEETNKIYPNTISAKINTSEIQK